jgi:hypothetical protein
LAERQPAGTREWVLGSTRRLTSSLISLRTYELLTATEFKWRGTRNALPVGGSEMEGTMFRTQQPSATLRSVVPAAAALICEILLAAHPLFAQGATSQGQSTTPASISVSSVLGTQNPYLGSVPAGKATGTVIPLSIRDALECGLKYNLGMIESDVGSCTARAAANIKAWFSCKALGGGWMQASQPSTPRIP